ncbi:MAG: GAF domain-containing protein [Candidatus Promineifilaceae bacterium]|nr:GAF domain-containing protein [Candidatus Promineifilaceae bacterium]
MSLRLNLRRKIVLWTFVPAAIILGAVTLVAFVAYQQVTAELVIARDQQLTRLSAGQLASEMEEFAEPLEALARMAPVYSGNPIGQQQVLEQFEQRFAIFDGGVVILDTFGRVQATQPTRPDIAGADWSDRDAFRRLVRTGRPVVSDMVFDGPSRSPVVLMLVPVFGSQGEFVGAVAGMLRLGATSISAFYGEIVKLRLGESGLTYLVDGQGRILYHSDISRVGRNQADQAIVQRVLAGETGAERTRDRQGEVIVAGYAPVPGTSWGLVTQERWDDLTSSYREYQRFLLILLALGVLVPAVVVGVGVRRITRPIQELSQAAGAVARGNFGQTIVADTGDELEDLAQQFNRMSAQLQASYADLEKRATDRTKELAALNAIAAVVSRSQNLNEILQNALETTLAVLAIQSGGIYLLDEEDQRLHLVAYRGFDKQFAASIDSLAVGEGFSGHVVATGEPVMTKDLATDTRLTRVAVRDSGFHSLVSFPVVASGRVFGALFLLTRDHRTFSRQDAELLTSIGRQIGVAVENTRLLAQVQQAGAAEERQRLARELHDAVTQTLFSATLIAEVLPRIWDKDPQLGKQRLRELHELNRGALAEMRNLLLELRPAALIESSLDELLRQLADAVVGRSRIPVSLEVEGEGAVPPDVRVALYRIAQESLNNVVKHAAASQVKICLTYQSDSVLLSIADDGRGFEAGVDQGGSFGIEIMGERARQIGAALEVASAPGAGTRINVIWPAQAVAVSS